MKRFQIVGMLLIVAASVLFPFQGRAEDKPPNAGLERLMQEKLQASGKAGALKQQLTKTTPEALKRYKKILELRARIEQLNAEIDTILKKESAEYRNLLREKAQLDRRYREAHSAQSGRK